MNTTLLPQIAERLGWTLLHSVWQFTVIALLLALASRLFCRESAQARYLAGCVSLALMAIAVPMTFVTVQPANRTEIREIRETHDVNAAVSSRSVENETGFRVAADADAASVESSTELPDKFDIAAVSTSEFGNGTDEPGRSVQLKKKSSTSSTPITNIALVWQISIGVFVDRWVVHLWIAWLVGILVLSVRPICGWHHARRLRRFGIGAVSPKICHMAIGLSHRIGLQKAVSVVESTLVDVPTVIGELRPLVLLPASAITGLSQEQLEAVMAHELAHVRRHDYLVNTLQTVAETIYFYHPALWWVSRQMRIDREDCCDDIAMSATGDRAGYARMLVVLETMRGESGVTPLLVSHAMSAGGGSLVSRIRRILQTPAPTHGTGSIVIGSVLLLAAAITILPLLLPTLSNAVAQDSAELQDPIDARQTETAEVESDDTDASRLPLELRILVNPAETEREPIVGVEDLAGYRHRLSQGDLGVDDKDAAFRWHPVADKFDTDVETRYTIQGELNGQGYVLTCNDPTRVVSWSNIDQHVKAVTVHYSEGDTPRIDIGFDDALTSQVVKLTSRNYQNRLAILINGKVVSAPKILALIHRNARITGHFTNEEARQLQSALTGAITADEDLDPARTSENSDHHSTTTPAASTIGILASGDGAEPWFRPQLFADTHRDLRFGKGRWFVQIGANRAAQVDLKISDSQRQAIEDIEKLYLLGGPNSQSTKTSKQRQQLWTAARKAAEEVLSERQVKQVEQLMIQCAGPDAFRDPVIMAALELTDQQREQINTEFDIYRHLLADNQSQADQAIMLVEPSLGNRAAGARHRTMRLQTLRREQLVLSQLWENIRSILTAEQQRQFNELRGPMPDLMQAKLFRPDAVVSVTRNRSSLAVLGPQRTDVTPVALDVPSDPQIIQAWTLQRKENGQPPPSPTEVLNFRRVNEKVIDFADAPRFFPLIGNGRLHHAMYKCSVFPPGKPVEVFYIDRTHLHLISNGVDSPVGETEFSHHHVEVRFESSNVDPNTNKTLIRYRIRNLGAKPLHNVRLVVSFDDSLRPKLMTEGGTTKENQLRWNVESMEAGQERVFEVEAIVDTDSAGRQTALVQVDGEAVSLGQFSLPKPAMKKPPPSAAKDPFPD